MLSEVEKIRLGSKRPGALCTAFGSMLLYVDRSKNPSVIRWLDLSLSPPREVKATNTDLQYIYSMVCVTVKDKHLLIAAGGEEGIRAYDTESNELLLRKGGKLPGMGKDFNSYGVTADDSGHLFVCDINGHCVQVFSVADGSYLGAILPDLRNPRRITWCKQTSHLFVADEKSERCYIKKIKLL